MGSCSIPNESRISFGQRREPRTVGTSAPEVLKSLVGQSSASGRLFMMETHGPEFPYDAIRATRLALEADYFRENEVPLKHGLLDIIGFFKAEKIPMAVATSTTRPRVMPLLRKAGLFEHFNFTILRG